VAAIWELVSLTSVIRVFLEGRTVKNCRPQAPRRIFVNSMSDLFHEGVPDSYIEEVSRVMVAANWLTDQVLTKRSERVRDLLTGRLRLAAEQANV